MKLTERDVKAYKPDPNKQQSILWDSEVKGFGIRFTENSKSFILNYRFNGVSRRITIGQYPTYSVMLAREQAKELIRLIDSGVDPLHKPEPVKAFTLQEFINEVYIPKYLTARRPKTAKDYQSLINHEIIPELGKIPLTEITHQHIIVLHQKIAVRTPYKANRMVSLCSVIFNIAIKNNYLIHNPSARIERCTEDKRERYLTNDELNKLINALTSIYEREAAKVLLILIYTGARKSEVLTAEWEHFNLIEKTWTKPSSHTKQKKIHIVPIPDKVVTILQDIQNQTTITNIDQANNKDQPTTDKDQNTSRKVRIFTVGDIKKTFYRACKIANIINLRIHDLRHSYASLLLKENVPLATISKLLGHTQLATTMRYAHLNNDILKDAVDILDKKLKD